MRKSSGMNGESCSKSALVPVVGSSEFMRERYPKKTAASVPQIALHFCVTSHCYTARYANFCNTLYKCHGPDGNERKAKLRFDIREEALKPAKSGERAIVPGAPERSQMVARITATDFDDRMPPLK